MFRGTWYHGLNGLDEALALRREVFVDEQGYSAENESDDIDARAMHAVIYDEDGIVATGRIYPDGYGKFHIGRVAVKKAKRGMGYGDLLVRMLLDKADTLGVKEVYTGAQAHAEGFYKTLGFVRCGEDYLDEGQPHIPMKMVGTAWRHCKSAEMI